MSPRSVGAPGYICTRAVVEVRTLGEEHMEGSDGCGQNYATDYSFHSLDLSCNLIPRLLILERAEDFAIPDAVCGRGTLFPATHRSLSAFRTPPSDRESGRNRGIIKTANENLAPRCRSEHNAHS
jgi:hypothetical protein